jgi:aminoglycoside 3-N-acetyltransferase
MLVDGVRKWVAYDFQEPIDADFTELGAAYEAALNIQPGRVGNAEVRFLKQRPMVDFAVEWMEKNRK